MRIRPQIEAFGISFLLRTGPTIAIELAENGKPGEIRGRKATGLPRRRREGSRAAKAREHT